MDFMNPVPDEQYFLERLSSQDETTRYKALLELKETPKAATSRIVHLLEELERDPSRPVRQLSRELHNQFTRAAGGTVQEAINEVTTDEYPGSPLLMLVSFGSTLTGIIGTGMSLLSYYLMGKFPFPNPIDVLLVVNIFLTLPYFVLGVLLLFSGKVQKQIALFYAYASLLGCLVLIGGLQFAFDAWWAVQFTQADQVSFRNFLSPFQLTTGLMPVIAGQALQIYFLTQFLAGGRRAAASNEVDTQVADG